MDAINSLKVKTIVICGSVVCLLIAFPYFFAGSPSTQNTPSYADSVKFPIEARCRIPQGEHNGAGLVSFTQLNPEETKISVTIDGLKKGEHGFHIHEFGNLGDGCKAAGAHYNPFNKNHGAPTDAERHVGDLGNLVVSEDNQLSSLMLVDKQVKLYGPYSVMGLEASTLL